MKIIINKLLKILIFIFTVNNTCAQMDDINIVNSTCNYNNYVEYNTGEIFVIYNFQNNLFTSKYIVNEVDLTVNTIQSNILLYPNPVVSNLYYELPQNIVFSSLEVLDTYQKQLLYLKKDEKFLSFDKFPTGVYYIKFNNKFFFKIIKQ